ncbi:MAG: hypothetical protein RPT25_05240 [Cycloclasticus sp.]|jgi:hypothetical protein
MQKLNSYSKYQKDIIKKISKELGPKTPFKHEKTSSNHLKILIEGLDKPLYTACTPSDRRSGDNFMADLRCALKAVHLKHQPKIEPSKRINTAQLKIQYIENLTASCIKTARTNIEQHIEKEKFLVIEENSISNLKHFRKSLATKIFVQCQKVNKQQPYITGADSSLIKREVIKHLNFMLPNTADYAVTLKSMDSMNKLSKAVSTANGYVNSPIIETANKGINNLNLATEIVTNVVNIDTTNKIEKKEVEQHMQNKKTPKERLKNMTTNKLMNSPNKNPAEELAAMTKDQAVKNLRRLSRNEGEAILSYIRMAMEENKQQDLHEVLEVMACKGITLDMLSVYQNNVA